MSADWEIDYPSLIQDSLRSVVRTLLDRVAEEGLPSGHHFYISFASQDPGVEIPGYLYSQFPERMNIVLQHQFWDLEVDEEAFSVTLRFGGTPHRIRVPFTSLESFVDPGAEFGLRFEAAPAENGRPTVEGESRAGETEEGSRERAEEPAEDPRLKSRVKWCRWTISARRSVSPPFSSSRCCASVGT